MSTVDQRIVNMQFNNSQFEKGISDSVRSLGNLKKGLDLDGAGKSLANLGEVTKGFNLNGVKDSVGQVSDKLTAMGIIGVTALVNITNQALDAGKKLAKSFTIDPIKTGFQEYETQINAIQTILANTASKGTTLPQVSSALDELNIYADKTIYNFTEMAKNIGTFTAAGVDLDTSVSAIKGIANLAAFSGASSQQASTGMYQLSQAISSGTVRLQDWNSVQNAGMGGQAFQDSLKETARVHGINVDDIIAKEGSFRGSLKEGWLSSTILTETLAKFTGDLSEEQLKQIGYNDAQIKGIMATGKTANDAATKVKTFTQLIDTLKEAAGSGWGQSWKHIIGDFEDAKALWTEASDVFGGMLNDSADVRNNLLIEWKGLGGRDILIDGIRIALQNLGKVIKPIRDAFKEIFPPATADQLLAFTQGFKDLVSYFTLSDDNAAKLKDTFKGVFAVIDIGKELVFALGEGLIELVKHILPAGDGILTFTANIGNFLVAIRDTIKESDIFSKWISGFVDFIKPAIKIITDFISGLTGMVGSIGDIDINPVWTFADNFVGPFRVIEALGKFLRDIFVTMKNNLMRNIEYFPPMLQGFKNQIVAIFSNFFAPIFDAFKSGNFDAVFDLINAVLVVGIYKQIKTFVTNMKDTIETGSGIFGKLTGMLDGVKDSLAAWQSTLKAKTLFTIAAAIALLAAALMGLSMIDSAKLAISLGAISIMMLELMTAMTVMAGMTAKKGISTMGAVTRAMVLFSVAILLLAIAAKKLASVDIPNLAAATVAIGVLMAMLVKAAEYLSENNIKMTRGAGSLILIAAAVYLLSTSVVKLAAIDMKGLAKGLIGVGGILAGIVIFLEKSQLDKLSKGSGTKLIALAAAIAILAYSVTSLAQLSVKQIIKGLGALAGIFVMLHLFLDSIGSNEKLLATATSLMVIAVAIKMFAGVISVLGEMPFNALLKGLGGLAITLAIVIAAMHALPSDTGLQALAMIGVAIAIRTLAGAVELLGKMPLNQLVVGLLGLGIAVGLLVIASNAMNGAAAGAVAFGIVAASLVILIPALVMLGKVPIFELVKALVALSAIFLIIGVASTSLVVAAPAMFLVALAIGALGLAIGLIGGGLLLFGAGMTSMAASSAAGTAAAVFFLRAIIDLIPFAAQKLGEAIIAFANVISRDAPILIAALYTLLEGILNTIILVIPKVEEAIMTFGYAILRMIEEFAPEAVRTLLNTFRAILEIILEQLPIFMKLGADIVVAFLNGIRDHLPRIIEAAFEVLLSFLNGMADAIEKNGPQLVDAGLRIARAIVNAIIKGFTGLFGIGSDAINSVRKGILSVAGSLATEAKNAGLGAIRGIKGAITGMFDIGWNMIMGMVGGVGKAAGNLAKAAKNAVTGAVDGVLKFLGIKSPSRLFMGVGRDTMRGMVVGIDKMKSKVATSAISVGEAAVDGITNAVRFAGDVLDGSFDIAPSVKPVLDMTLLQDAKDIQQALDGIVGKYGVLDTVVKSEQKVEMTHKFDKLVVEGVNDKGEFVETADYAVEDILTAMMRRQSRL